MTVRHGCTRLVVPVVLMMTFVRGATAQVSPALQQRINAVTAMIRGDSVGADTIFSPIFRSRVTMAQLRSLFDPMTASYGRLDTIGATAVSATVATLRFNWQGGFSAGGSISISAASPNLVDGFFIRNASSSAQGLSALGAAFRSLPGANSFLVTELAGNTMVPMLAVDTGRVLAIGSAFKLYVLAAITRDIEEGARRWADSVPYDSAGRSLPSGISQRWRPDTSATLREWTSLMISISDNTAADRLLRLEGREKVEQLQASVGNSHGRRNVPFLATREMFLLKSPDQVAARTRYLGGSVAVRRSTLDELDHLPQSAVRPDFSHGPVAIDSLEWFASVADLARTMRWLRDHSSGPTTGGTRDILAINPVIPLSTTDFPYIGAKGGSEPGVLNITQLLKRSDGRWFVISATSNNPDAEVSQLQFLAFVQRAGELLAPPH